MKLVLTFLIMFSSPLMARQMLVPVTYSKAYDDPRYLVLEANGITAVMEHLNTNYSMTIFDVEIINESGIPIKIEPKNFHYYAGRNPFPELTSEEDDIHQLSYPNSQIPGFIRKSMKKSTIEQQYKNQMRQQQSMVVFLNILSVGMVALDVVQDIKDVQKEIYTEKDWQKSQVRDALVATSLITSDVITQSSNEKGFTTSEDLHYLSQEYFEDNELPDSSSARGKVYFPRTGNYRYYRVVVPLEGINFVFDFRKARTDE